MPIQGVTFVSREIAEAMNPPEKVGIISIAGTGPHFLLADLRPGWGAVLRLNFDDITKQWQNYVMMSSDQAKEVIAWLDEHGDELDGVVVHCEAGMSRSAAVAKFIGDRYGIVVDEYESRYYNQHVYRMLTEIAAGRRPVIYNELP